MFSEVELMLDEPDGWMDYDEKVHHFPPLTALELNLSISAERSTSRSDRIRIQDRASIE